MYDYELNTGPNNGRREINVNKPMLSTPNANKSHIVLLSTRENN